MEGQSVTEPWETPTEGKGALEGKGRTQTGRLAKGSYPGPATLAE